MRNPREGFQESALAFSDMAAVVLGNGYPRTWVLSWRAQELMREHLPVPPRIKGQRCMAVLRCPAYAYRTCTRLPGHTGRHHTEYQGRIVAVWE